MSGKWHLGDKPDGFPTEHGFDYVRNFVAYYAGVYFNPGTVFFEVDG